MGAGNEDGILRIRRAQRARRIQKSLLYERRAPGPASCWHQPATAGSNFSFTFDRRKRVERSLVIVKPDGVQRQLIGPIITRLEQRGLKIVALKMIQVSQDLARKHYAVHEGKAFFEPLIKYITSAPVVAMVVEGPHAIEITRNAMGATSPVKAAPGTIRADYALEIGRNLVHGSDGPETAAAEIALWFADGEILSYQRDVDRWILE
jgi:nucleoside-diphosphate kinase